MLMSLLTVAGHQHTGGSRIANRG